MKRPIIPFILFLSVVVAPANAAPALPDPGRLITVAELESIVGKIKKGPAPLDTTGPEAIGCEYTRDIEGDDAWVNVEIYPAERYPIDFARAKFGGKTPQPVPEFGKDAFINPEYVGYSAELWVQKGNFLLRVSLPTGPGVLEQLKAIVRKALSRM